MDNLDTQTTLYLETTTHVSPGGWSHHENPLGRALYVLDELESTKTPNA